MNKGTIILIIVVILSIIFAVSIIIYHLLGSVKQLNKESDPNRETNELAFPLIDDNRRYIQKQTEVWYDKRRKKEPCYAVLEKDKIVMSKWIEMAKIKTPKIHYYSYHDQFTFDKLCNVIEQNEGKSLIIKITHLQSNYGIILVPPDPTIEKIEQIYKTCQDKFKTSFVCNHDFSDPPTNKEIKMGRKPSYYKLYETIKPGVIIQEYFESYTDGSKNIPIEYKILMYGDKILNIGGGLLTSTSIYMDQERYEPLVEEARKISKFLGATLIRVDFFVRENDNPYIPYLNEISLSPNGGMNRAMAFSNLELDEMKKEMNNTPRGNYGELNKLIQQCPYRYTPIERYLTDAESVKEKY